MVAISFNFGHTFVQRKGLGVASFTGYPILDFCSSYKKPATLVSRHTVAERTAETNNIHFGANSTMLRTNSSMFEANSSMFESNSTKDVPNMGSTTRDPQVDLVFNIRFWVFVTVIPVGIIGNMLCVLVMSQKQNRKSSCSTYMGSLAIVDTIVLISQGGMTLIHYSRWLVSILTIDKLNIMCKVCAYSLFSAAFSGTMIILALLVERVIVVTCPLKAAVLLSPRRAMMVISIIIIFTFAYNIPLIFSATMMNHFGLQCISVPGSGYASAIYHVSKIVLSGVVPFVAILTMNITILCAVKSSKKQQKRMSAQRQQSPVRTVTSSSGGSVRGSIKKADAVSKMDRQLTIMTVVLTIAFLCLTMPKYAHQLAWMNIDWQSSTQMVILFGWSGTISQELYILNSVVNFFLYVMTGSKFRQDLRTMFQCKTVN